MIKNLGPCIRLEPVSPFNLKVYLELGFVPLSASSAVRSYAPPHTLSVCS
ncbi:hypothetical protein HanPSC8_Chr07g0280421 [Helianthus annuus]|nr:hypothetical protein HanPSC8_Chr07g0280421 [Helianthus annuus]